MRTIPAPRALDRISALLAAPFPSDTAHVLGTVARIRRHKNTTFVELCDGSTLARLHVVLKGPHKDAPVTLGASLEVRGTLARTPAAQLELVATELAPPGDMDIAAYPLAKHAHIDHLRAFPHLRPRTALFQSIFAIRNHIIAAIHAFYQSKHYTLVSAPVITANDCEGAGDVFSLRDEPPAAPLFRSPPNLTVSGQLHLEPFCKAFANVYTLGPAFRRENSHSSTHLAEFHMLEVESVLPQLPQLPTGHPTGHHACDPTGHHACDPLMHELFALNRQISAHLHAHCLPELECINKTLTLGDTYKHVLETAHASPVAISYKDALRFLADSQAPANTPPPAYGDKLSKAHELALAGSYAGNRPVFVVDYPAAIKAFYMKRSSADPSEALCFDYIAPRVGELAGGSVREDRLQHLYPARLQQPPIPFLADTRRFGSFPHGGYGLGLERLIMYHTGVPNIRDTIPYPVYAGATLL